MTATDSLPEAGVEARVIPMPRRQRTGSGRFRFDAETRVCIDSEEVRRCISPLVEMLSRSTGFALPIVKDDGSETNTVRVLADAGLSGPECYRLRVTNAGILIRAFDRAGALYAWQTLRQLLPAGIEASQPVRDGDWTVPAVEIEDAPRFAYRGMHLDVSRHFFSVGFIKRYLDWMAKYKLNVFHWHLTDDQGWRIEIAGYPRLTSVGAWRPATVRGHTLDRDASLDGCAHGGYYTQDEVREIVEYACTRCITIVPEIDMPGHCSALLAAYPQFGCREGPFEVETHFGVFRDILNPSDETLEMAKDVLGEVAALFPGPYLHIGGDEVDTAQWEDSDECRRIAQERGLDSTKALYRDFIARLRRTVNELGKEPIGWDDILDGGSDGPVTVTVWRGDEKLVAAAREGHDVILAPAAFYFDFYQSESLDEPLAVHGLTTLRDMYECRLIPESLEAPARKRILGGEGLLWTEYVATEAHAEYMLMPRLCALAERLWCSSDALPWTPFAARLRHHLRRFEAMNVNASGSVYNVTADVTALPEGGFRVSLDTAGDRHAIRYTLDGSAAHAASLLYESPLTVTSRSTVRAVSVDTDDGRTYGDIRLELSPNKASGCDVTLNTAAETGWGLHPERRLVDGLLRREGFFLHRQWTGFDGVSPDAVLDLRDAQRISRVRVGFAGRLHRALYPPTSMRVAVSDDASSWRQVGRVHAADIGPGDRCIEVEFEAVTARYVHVRCENGVSAYSHETKREQPVTVYIDQIEVF